MKPVGKTYLIEVFQAEEEVLEGGIVVPQSLVTNTVNYIGKLIEYRNRIY